MRTLLLLILMTCLPSYGQANTLSFWSHSEGSGEYSSGSEIQLYRVGSHIGSSICGTIQQGNILRAPSGRFVGKAVKGGFVVEFDDSFAAENDFGIAFIKIEHRTLTWQVIKRPRGGYLSDIVKLRRVASLPSERTLNKSELRECDIYDGDAEKLFLNFGSR